MWNTATNDLQQPVTQQALNLWGEGDTASIQHYTKNYPKGLLPINIQI